MEMLNLSYLISTDTSLTKSILKSVQHLGALRLKHVNSKVSNEDILSIVSLLKEEIEIEFSSKRIGELLAAYPDVKAQVLEFGISDTEAVSSIFNMISHFYLGTAWPINKDKHISIEFFVEKLRAQVLEVGA